MHLQLSSINYAQKFFSVLGVQRACAPSTPPLATPVVCVEYLLCLSNWTDSKLQVAFILHGLLYLNATFIIATII